MQPYPRVWAEIDLKALDHNLRYLRGVIGEGPQIALVAKADGYGHGLVPISRQALRSGAEWIAIATVSEAIGLRDAGIDAPILVLSPMLPIEADQAVFYELDVMAENDLIIEAMEKAAESQNRKAHLHLKVDTGLHRFGCQPDEALRLAQRIHSSKWIEFRGIAQHFVDSTGDDEKTKGQIAIFHRVLDQLEEAGCLPPVIHMANSAGTVKHPAARHTLVRIGQYGYGLDPRNVCQGNLKPVMRMMARVTSIRDVKAGETIGYASTYKAERDMKIATLGAGYGDGYPRHLGSKGVVWLKGKERPVCGLVCMDLMMIDVSESPSVELGDIAVLIGDEIKAGRLADLSGTNSHEIVTRIMSRVPRRYSDPA